VNEKSTFFNIEADPFQSVLGCENYCNQLVKLGWNEKYCDVIVDYKWQIKTWYGIKDITQHDLDLKKKKKKILVMISNCNPERLEAVRKYVPRDLYDYCGNCDLENKVKCPPRTSIGGDEFSLEVINFVKQYKFYLSFENTNLKNYVTEKFYKAIQARTIPIAFSRKYYPERILKWNFPIIFLDECHNECLTNVVNSPVVNNTDEFFSEEKVRKFLVSRSWDSDVCEIFTSLKMNETKWNFYREKTNLQRNECIADCNNNFGKSQNFNID